MAMKNDAKFEDELICQFKIDMKNQLNFDPRTQKISKNCTLIGGFDQGVIHKECPHKFGNFGDPPSPSPGLSTFG